MSGRAAFAPGRVNLIGDHTDHAGGLVLPMAVQLGTTVAGEPGGEQVVLRSDDRAGVASMPLDVADPATVRPAWARYVAGVVAEVRPSAGFDGTVSTTLPVGAGLSSSAALEVAVALALGADLAPTELALACQRAEQRASGVPSGVMDQLAAAAGVDGAALLIDCADLTVTPVPMPAGLDVVVVHSGVTRTLAGSGYADRRADCEAAAARIGPLREATPADVDRLDDERLRRRARHVVGENERVLDFAEALRADDRPALGRLLGEGHASLRDDFEVSTPEVDALVARLTATSGVHGARMTGGGFGGCVVALAEPGALREGWTVHPSTGAHLLWPR